MNTRDQFSVRFSVSSSFLALGFCYFFLSFALSFSISFSLSRSLLHFSPFADRRSHTFGGSFFLLSSNLPFSFLLFSVWFPISFRRRVVVVKFCNKKSRFSYRRAVSWIRKKGKKNTFVNSVASSSIPRTIGTCTTTTLRPFRFRRPVQAVART